MPEIHFSSLDLNLLRVFDALAEEASVTRAGERLGLTQSAVSHALGRQHAPRRSRRAFARACIACKWPWRRRLSNPREPIADSQSPPADMSARF
jgi:DNA-binding transcriptional ArsR family regulator